MRRSSRGPRGTVCKTGQATRDRHRRQLLKLWGPYCWMCVLAGLGLELARIDLSLKWPDPGCFTRDHVIPRSRGGTDDIGNLRPAHHRCNSQRGAKEAA